MFEPISELAEINPPLSASAPIHSGDFISFIPMSDVSESGQWLTYKTRAFSQVKSGFTPFQEGDVLFAKITPCMENGKGAQAVGLEKGIGYGSTEFHILRAKADNSPRYIFHLSQSSNLRLKAEASMIGSAGQKRVPSEFLRKHRVFAPIPAEQRLIARILDTLDTQIEQTEALIAKLEKVKEGLLHDLLTRGIDENGQLRPSPEQAPELYQESSLGLIPREWLIKEIQSICKLGRGRVISQGYLDTHPGPFPVYSSQTKNGGVFGRINEYEFEGPHVTWTTDGANAGTVMYRDGKFNCTNVCGTLESLGETIHMPFLAWALDKLTDRYVSRVGNDKLMNNVVAKMQVQIPSKNEQVRCTKSLEPIENTIQYETNSLTKIKAQKAALMDDLLTGRVRVTPLLEQQKEVISA